MSRFDVKYSECNVTVIGNRISAYLFITHSSDRESYAIFSGSERGLKRIANVDCNFVLDI